MLQVKIADNVFRAGAARTNGATLKRARAERGEGATRGDRREEEREAMGSVREITLGFQLTAHEL